MAKRTPASSLTFHARILRLLAFLAGTLAVWTGLDLCDVADSPVRFQKYRVAPRLGTDRVRQRLLMGIEMDRRSITATGGGWVG